MFKHLFTARLQIAVFLGLVFLISFNLNAQKNTAIREKLVMDYDWTFKMGDYLLPDYNYNWMNGYYDGVFTTNNMDSAWRKVDLPHDWTVELPFVNPGKDNQELSPKINKETLKLHGYKPIGQDFPENSKAIYRKVFTIDKGDDGKRILIKFDGIFRNSTIFLNTFRLGNNFSGYSECMFDVTDMLNYGGKNTLVVMVDATQLEGWFYEGAGIYRHVWLIKYAPLHIPMYGNQVISSVAGNKAKIMVETQVFNQDRKKANCNVELKLIDKFGKIVANANKPLVLKNNEQLTVKNEFNISNPDLWSLETPSLYKVVSSIYVDNNKIDEYETKFGIRTITFDANKGFFLNGKSVKIKGTCNHQDHAGVGSAIPDRLQYYRLQKLKEMGANAYRTAHHPPSIELLEACDSLGIMVCDENRLLGASEERLNLFKDQIIRDRNHPCVIMWSIGNEEQIQNNDFGHRIALSMMDLQKRLDPSRLCIYAANNGNKWEGINNVIDIRGYNYNSIESDQYHKEHPGQIMMGSEESSALGTRGQYFNDPDRGFVAAYDRNAPAWGYNAEQFWTYYDSRPYLAGAFVWTGFDYRGEPTPYAWPCISSHFGIMDVCGFPKDNYFYYQSWWSDKNVLHLFPHWNWKGRTGDTIDVWCHTNCQSVELFLNGASLGKKNVTKNGHLEWKVAYVPGILEAKGIRNGKTINDKVETTGESYALSLSSDVKTIKANGEDLSIITVTAIDEKGREVPTADDHVKFQISGNGKIIGVGNGNPVSHEADKFVIGNYFRSLFNGKCQLIIQSDRVPGDIKITATSERLKKAELIISSEVAPCRPYVK